MRRLVALLASVMLAFGLASCSSPYRDGSDGGGVCGLSARFQGRLYEPRGKLYNVKSRGEALTGRAVVPPCEGEGFSMVAYAIDGVDPRVAFLTLNYQETVFVAVDIDALPAELEALMRPRWAS